MTSTGRVKDLLTHRLMAADEAMAMFAQAKTALGSYEVPSG